ncbi:MAG: nuclear transport factor 2 family protein, partial [Pseudomonadota bacterium]
HWSPSTIEERFSTFYDDLNLDTLSMLGDVYHPDVTFVDPVGSYQGLDHLDAYFRKLLSGNTDNHFVIEQLRFKDTIGFVTWRMNFTTPRLNRGRNIVVDGASAISVENNLVSFQRDYYDLGSMVYEHVPVLRKIVRSIRTRMAL